MLNVVVISYNTTTDTSPSVNSFRCRKTGQNKLKEPRKHKPCVMRQLYVAMRVANIAYSFLMQIMCTIFCHFYYITTIDRYTFITATRNNYNYVYYNAIKTRATGSAET